MRGSLTLVLAALFVLGCNEEEQTPGEGTAGDAGDPSERDATPAASPGRDATTPVLDAGACVNPGCAKSDMWNATRCRCEAGCSLLEEVSRRAGGPDTVDCGTLQPTTDLTALRGAQQCVLDAIAAGRPFQLIHSQRGTDSQIATAYLSNKASEPLSVLTRDSDPSGGG